MTSYFVKTSSPGFQLPQVILDNLPDWATQDEVDEAIKGHLEAAAKPTSHRHLQTVPSATWVIPHPLDFSPSVTVTDSAGTVILTEIVYVAPNLVHSISAGAFSGTAYLS